MTNAAMSVATVAEAGDLEAPTLEVTEADIDEVLATCSDDPRAAIRALLIGQRFLEAALEEARHEASWGYVRGRPSRRLKDAQEG